MIGILLVLIGLAVVIVPMRDPRAAWIRFFCILLLIVICLVLGWPEVRAL